MVGTHHPRRLTVELQRISDYLWEIPRQGGMRVPGRIYASEKLMAELRDDPALEQVANVAHLPGIVGYVLAMPDIHWGYGFPIGGVAAVDAEAGALSRGGPGVEQVPCRVARPRRPGVRRRPSHHGTRHGALRERHARPQARLRAARLARGARVLRGHGGGRELRLDEPAGDERPRR